MVSRYLLIFVTFGVTLILNEVYGAPTNTSVQTCELENGVTGGCIELKECPSFWGIRKKQLTDTELTIDEDIRLQDAMQKCAQTNSITKVCCVRCGQLEMDGQNMPDVLPWAALIEHQSASPTTGISVRYCGATLISDRWLITTISCAPTFLEDTLVYLGLKDQEDGEYNKTNIISGIDTVTIRYNPSTSGVTNDVALIRLEKKVAFNSEISPVCLPTVDDLKSENFYDLKANTPRWKTVNAEENFMNHSETVGNIFDQKKSLENITSGNPPCTFGQDCANTNFEGNYGAPLTIQKNGVHYLVGIISRGLHYDQPRQLAVYLNMYVIALFEWIISSLEN